MEVLPVGRPQRRQPGAAGRAPGCTVAAAAAGWAFRRSHSPHRAGGAESTPSRTSSRESHAGVQRFNAAWRCRQPAQGLMPTAFVALATASPMPGRAGPGGVQVPLFRFGRSAMTRLKSATSTSFMLPSGIFHQNWLTSFTGRPPQSWGQSCQVVPARFATRRPAGTCPCRRRSC